MILLISVTLTKEPGWTFIGPHAAADESTHVHPDVTAVFTVSSVTSATLMLPMTTGRTFFF